MCIDKVIHCGIQLDLPCLASPLDINPFARRSGEILPQSFLIGNSRYAFFVQWPAVSFACYLCFINMYCRFPPNCRTYMRSDHTTIPIAHHRCFDVASFARAGRQIIISIGGRSLAFRSCHIATDLALIFDPVEVFSFCK